jgi:hypothetical protein
VRAPLKPDVRGSNPRGSSDRFRRPKVQDIRPSTGRCRVRVPPGVWEEQRVAQFGSARASGARGRRFESFHAEGNRAGVCDPGLRAGGRRAMQRAVTPPSYFDIGGSNPSLRMNAEVAEWRCGGFQLHCTEVRFLPSALDDFLMVAVAQNGQSTGL